MRSSLKKEYGCIPVTTRELKSQLNDYAAPLARIGLLQRRKEILPLRRNLYLCNPEEYSRELIANHLLAPSYISYEYVLSACGIIPERVHVIRSSCMKRGRRFENATGHYEYITVPAAYYPEGVTIKRTEHGYGYMIARPEKALSDLILATPGLRLQSAKAAREYLELYLRADLDALSEWSPDLIHTLAELTTKKKNDLFHLEQMLRHEYL